MSEAKVILNTPSPRTRRSLAADLHQLGLAPEMTVLVHSSLSSLGWVCGGPVTVVQALMDTVTPAGTLVMPTHSSDYSDPAQWQAPPYLVNGGRLFEKRCQLLTHRSLPHEAWVRL